MLELSSSRLRGAPPASLEYLNKEIVRSRHADGWNRLVWRKRSFGPYADRGHGDVSATNLRLDRPGAAGGAGAVDHRGTACRCRVGRGLFLVDCMCRADRPVGIGRL